MSSGAPWGMINARRERDTYRDDLSRLHRMIALGLEEALRELEKPKISNVKITEILQRLRTQL